MHKTILIPTSGEPHIHHINDWKDMQAAVGGTFAAAGHNPDDYELRQYANDDGIALGLPFNGNASAIYANVNRVPVGSGFGTILGQAIVIRTDSETGETIDITDEDVKWVESITKAEVQGA